MASSETYSKESIIDFKTDQFTVDEGTVTRNNKGVITLSNNSKCTFSKSFGDEGLNTTKLKVNYGASIGDIISRYNNSLSIKVKVHYYNRDYENGEYTYTDGKWQTIDIIPYGSSEKKGNYKGEIIDTDGDYIKEMRVSLRYSGTEDNVKVNKLDIYNAETLDADKVVDTVLNDTDISDYIDSKIQDYITSPSGSEEVQNIVYRSGVVFPIYETMSGIPSNAPDGFACIVLNA